MHLLVFDIARISCIHAIADAKRTKKNENMLLGEKPPKKRKRVAGKVGVPGSNFQAHK